MKWFKKLKVNQKLIASFFCIAVFIGAVGFIGTRNMNIVNKNSSNMYNINLKSNEQLTKLKSNIADINYDVLKINYQKNKNIYDDTIPKEINALLEENNSIISNYEKNILPLSSADEKKFFITFKDNFDSYKTTYDECIKFIDKNKSNEADIDLDKLSTIKTTIYGSLNHLMQTSANNANNSYRKNKSKYNVSLYVIIAITIAGIILAILFGAGISARISKQIKKALKLAEAIGEGDLTQSIEIDSEDEFGDLGKALNNAGKNVKKLISEIIKSAEEMSAASEELSATTEEIYSKMEVTHESTEHISKGSQDVSTATEGVNASITEISAAADNLNLEADDAEVAAEEIQKRADGIKEKATKNIEEGNKIYDKSNSDITNAIENAKVVKEVKMMADSIEDIAEQTNLLALNAAIEAARAGEHGKGFSVVADEVAKLAEQSSEAVHNIQDMVVQVQGAVNALSQSGREVLEYLNNDVKPSYQFLMEVGNQYGEDAGFINSIVNEIASSSKQMDTSVEQVSSSVQNASQAAQESASSSEEILSSIDEITSAINEVAKSAQSQAELSQKLNEMIQKFTI